MDADKTALARTCLDGAEGDSLSFPQIVDALTRGGFEGYAVDYRAASATYYAQNGDCVALPTHRADGPIADRLDVPAIQAAIREAQEQAPGYSYAGFCVKAMAAGCAGYIVSFTGRRVLYFGRTAETHVEHFPSLA